MVNLVDVFSEFKSGKNIDRPTMVRVLEDVFRTLIKKKYGTDDNFDVIVNTSTGDLEIWRVREVVPDGEVTNELAQVSITEAHDIDESVDVGDECYEQLSIEDFGRRAIMAARQTLVSRIMELEKDEIFRKYSERVGEVITGEVNQIMKREILILDDATSNELVLPRTEMIRGDYYRKGDMVKGIISKVEMRNNVPYIMVSRTDPDFLAKLLEAEVPEIEDGVIDIKNIVRLPGERAKVAVESHDERIDPVGACVGMKGSRIHGIVRELRNENIDVISYTSNDVLYIQRSLSPAKISSIKLNEEERMAQVYLKPDQISLAIGKNGLNIKLAGKLTDYQIDVYREIDPDEEDIDLDEFNDEIEQWIINELKRIGCDTAMSVLDLSAEELMRRSDLDEETVVHVLDVLKAEFEDEE